MFNFSQIFTINVWCLGAFHIWCLGILQSSNSNKETLNSVLNLLLHYYRHNLGEVLFFFINITTSQMAMIKASRTTCGWHSCYEKYASLSWLIDCFKFDDWQDCASGELPVPVIPPDSEELSTEMVARYDFLPESNCVIRKTIQSGFIHIRVILCALVQSMC